MTKTGRLSWIRALLDLSVPIPELRSHLREFSWDYEGDEEIITCAQLSNVLSRYFRNELSDADVEAWANLVENREDVRFQQSHERQIRDVVFELANPTLTQRLDKNRASILISELTTGAETGRNLLRK